MINKKAYIFGFVLIFILSMVSAEPIFSSSDNGDFEVDNFFLKITLTKGGSFVNSIKILNKDSDPQDFLVELKNIKDLVFISEKSFSLGSDGEHSLEIFVDVLDIEPGVYIGSLEISSEKSIKIIPIIIEVQSEEVLFDSNLDLSNRGVLSPGDKLNSQISIFDLASIGRTEISLKYFVKDFSGGTIISESENRIVEGKLDYSKTFELPELELGNYVLVVIIEQGDSVGTSTILFSIEKSGGFSPDFVSNIDNFTVILIFFGFFFLIFLVIFAYSIFHKDRLLMRLQTQYINELKRQKTLINQKGQRDCSKLKGVEKKVYKRELRKVKKQRIGALKAIHKKRIQQFKKAKKQQGKSQLNIQLEKWKEKGYDTSALERKFKMPEVKNIKDKVKAWKAKGYDTSSLEKKMK